MKWHTEQRKINDLIPTENNPRQLTEKQYSDLKKSLKKFDLAEIPAINTDGQILAGHMRLKIMRAIGRGEEIIDVRIPDRKLTKAESEEYLIRSNKNTAEWDFDKLCNFDVKDLTDWGFDEEELIGSTEEKIEQKEEELTPYKKAHVLISVDINKIHLVGNILDQLKKIEGVEIEQSAN